MTAQLLIQAINALISGFCEFVKTMQANPVGAFCLLTMTAFVVLTFWLHKRSPPDPPPRRPKRPAAKKRPSASRDAG